MIRIPAGVYRVGSSVADREELGRRYGFHPSFLGDELDAKDVELKEFFMDEYPVTNAQYAAFIAATGAPEPYDWPLHATPERAHHPVVGVGGEDAKRYAEWAGKRLPTPEEWEAAFRGMPLQPVRKVKGSHWLPITFTAADDPGPRSEFGVHGFGQVTEWTTATTMNGPHPFRLMKGAWWMVEEGWGLRPQASSFGFAPWCRQWTGLRCAADRDVASVPTGTLNPPCPNYHLSPIDLTRKAATVLTGGGGGGASIEFPGIREALGVAAPEGCPVDDGPAPAFKSELAGGTVAGKAGERVAYTLKSPDLDLEVEFKAGADWVELDYAVVNRRTVPVTVRPSSCVCAGLMDPFYDFEGSRTHICFGRGGWVPLRSLPRHGNVKRWISYTTPYEPCPETALVGVIGRDSPYIFGYGRVGLTHPLNVANNWCFSCLHLDPLMVAAAGARVATRARLYCIRGGLDELRARFVQDFGLAGR